MYDIKQFRFSMYVLVLVGIIGFTVAADLVGLGVIAVTLILINAWFVRSGQFKPIPPWLASLVSIPAAVYAFTYCYQAMTEHLGSPIVMIGEFLVVMQVVKLWEQRANRDYLQIMGLSLLLMIASAISTASLVFGLLLIGYLFLSLHCSLLFHVKLATEEAGQQMSLPERQTLDPTGTGDIQHNLLRSLRRVAAVIFGFAVLCSVIVFLFLPRSASGRWLGELQWRPQEAMTGFSDQVSYDRVAQIAQDDAQVGTIKVWHDGQVLAGTEPLMLRGVTLDYYSGNEDTRQGVYQWSRSSSQSPGGLSNNRSESEVPLHQPWITDRNLGQPHYQAEVTLASALGSAVLPTLAGPQQITVEHAGARHRLALQYNGVDETVEASDPLPAGTQYRFWYTNSLGPASAVDRPDPYRSRSNIDPVIKAFALRNDVSGLGLAQRRMALVDARRPAGTSPFIVTPLDESIARNIEQYLRSHYAYTLDLTSVGDLNGKDPMAAFLTDFKRGHCEYFAGAMTLMCQSLYMDARMVVGFACDPYNYNSFGHYYTIRQSQAHAWVEVLTPTGWKSFDPTSGHEADAQQITSMQKAKRFFEFLEYTWANAVVAYDADARDKLVHGVQQRATRVVRHPSVVLEHLKDALDTLAGWLAMKFVGPLIALLSIAMIAAVGWFSYERWRLHCLAARVGIEALSTSDQQRLARQLAFYDDLLRLLERHHIHRPRHLTPLEFSDSLAYLPSDIYDSIHRLTHLFYRIRYGRLELPPPRHRHLDNAVQRVGAALDRVPVLPARP